ncbi:CbtB domain-containing protein [Segnochrobactraceae bacterium EtOH-i3]
MSQSAGATAPSVDAGIRPDVRRSAVVAFCVGAAFVFLTGFASPSVLHNAAHDTRHALSFPCH